MAVLSLCRDRLEYTKHCFATLRKCAGCDYMHFVLDQGSTDGTVDWLVDGQEYASVKLAGHNLGYHRGMNVLLDWIGDGDYDAVVTMDNDCELVLPNTLRVCAEIAAQGEWIVSPTVQGLNNPPRPGPPVVVNGERVGPYPAIGGIFRAMPGAFAREFRFNESNPLWGGDEGDVGRAAREQDIDMGYLLDWHVNHYRTTSGQHAEYPAYFARTLAEGKPSL